MIRANLLIAAFSCVVAAFAFAAAPSATLDQKAISIDNMQFKPDPLSVNVGDTVEWTNNDDRDHTVVAKDDSFHSGNLSSGATFKFTFKKPGKFAYGCILHPRMKGTIIVSP